MFCAPAFELILWLKATLLCVVEVHPRRDMYHRVFLTFRVGISAHDRHVRVDIGNRGCSRDRLRPLYAVNATELELAVVLGSLSEES